MEGFDAFEGMNALYRFDVRCAVAPEISSVVDASLGCRARLQIGAAPHGRIIHGVIGEMSAVAASGVVTHVIALVPELALLHSTQDSRVFQGMTTAEVVREVLSQHRIGHVFLLSRRHAPKRYCVQYEESDADFVLRLLAEEGLFAYFQHFGTQEEGRTIGFDGTGECLVIADAPSVYPHLPWGARNAVLTRGAATVSPHGDVIAFERTRRVSPTAFTLRGYDPARAGARAGRPLPSPKQGGAPLFDAGVTTAAAHASDAGRRSRQLEIYEHHGLHEDTDVDQARADAALEQRRADADSAQGSSRCHLFAPGHTFHLRAETGEDLGEQVITSVTHSITSASEYDNRFTCAPAHQPVRPVRPHRRVIQVVETAVIVGLPAEPVTTDAFGSVKIQFHWDRSGAHDDRSSCWVRVMQPWSGSGYGFQFVPRVGAEVLVSFVGGDPDRPIVLGCLPNAVSPLPFPLPSRTQTGIRTRSVDGGGGHNQLLFDDEPGAEMVQIRAQRDHEEVVLGEQRINVSGLQRTVVGAERRTEVRGSDRAEILGERVEHVHGQLTQQIDGAAALHIDGAQHVRVGGDHDEVIEGSSIMRTGGSLHLVIGTSGEGDANLQASGVTRLSGAGGIELRSQVSITLAVGESRVTLGPDGIVLDAPEVTVRSQSIHLGNDDSGVHVDDAIELSSNTVFVRGKSSLLELTDDARLLGRTIKLTGPVQRPVERTERTNDEPGEAVFRVQAPEDFNGPLVLRIASSTGEILERDADANREVRLPAKLGETYTLVEVRRGDQVLTHYPPDE